MVTVQQLAGRFAHEVRSALTPKQLAEANRLNVKSGSDCHTHDFIDANECMIAALAHLGAPDDFGLGDTDAAQVEMNTINSAWNLAKRAQFAL